jgi:hypothetical protein
MEATMLRVTIDLVPYGDETRKRNVAVVEIGNDCTGDVATGNYNIRAEGVVDEGGDDGYDSWAPARLEGFSRARGYLALAHEALAVLEREQIAEAARQAARQDSFMDAYASIRDRAKAKGRWSDADETAYRLQLVQQAELSQDSESTEG